MIKLNPELLSSENIGEPRGLYNPMQFVLRLRKDIQRELNDLPLGIYTASDITATQLQAYSTYLHETIHWWQHVGSNFGLVSSLKFPVQHHLVYSILKKVLETIGPFKSILKYNAADAKDENINQILNNWYDIEFASQIAFDPSRIERFTANPYFESWGHSYHIMWGATNWTLASTFDPDLSFLPNINNWGEGFRKLKDSKTESFYYGSPNTMPPLGTRSIFEGQARFSQLQYLYFASGGKLDFNAFHKAGMLEGIYNHAFTLFLEILGEAFPATPDHPLIALFLLVCDLAINPVDGFPFDLTHHEVFIITNDPGYRFTLICQMIRDYHPDVKKAIRNYSKDEYIYFSEKLSSSIGCFSPHESATFILNWIKSPSIRTLLEQEESYQYTSSNLPIRLFFSKFLRFQEDKAKHPQFFCWPGIHMIEFPENKFSLVESYELFEKHKALFIDDENGNIFHSACKKYTVERVNDTFNNFFGWNTLYTMVREWIAVDGPFTYDYQWLSTNINKDEMKNWVCQTFESTFNVHPDSFKIL
ncbi:hypothetical protein DVR12_19585 [Chitinophaga silvatica]|uniref:Uncharacterized protein n=1 Tax=Chitinophaga silvatica TaxID=2282649 RepID=A0A3E1Y5C4_9BACT|nr:hypothetical protein [Chitinophaga silvatica]RFS19934.1 hypothetical protein DVR12_19585 [Chitinophaga silvatica]